MIRPCHIAAALLLVSSSALATTGGPNSFEPLGVDGAGKVLLRENVGGESGLFRLWTFDAARRGPAEVKDLDRNFKAPTDLKQLGRLALNEVTFSGEILGQSLFPREDVLLHKFDLRVKVAWKGASSTVDLVAFKTAQVVLADTYTVPGTECAIAFLSTLGKPEETGYQLQKPVMICAKPVLKVAPDKLNKTLRNPR